MYQSYYKTMKNKEYSFKDATTYDSFWHVYKRGNSAHLAGMTDGQTYTGYTLCGAKVQQTLGRRYNDSACTICNRKAQVLDAEQTPNTP